jgi:hypothetical protein
MTWQDLPVAPVYLCGRVSGDLLLWSHPDESKTEGGVC